VSGPVETHRGMVRREHCDHFGHMNVQFYDAALSDAFFYMMNLIGLGRAEVERRRIGLAAIEMTLNYRRELRPGDHFKVETGFLRFESRELHTAHRMIRLSDGKLALTARSSGLPLDLDRRRRTEIPEDIVQAAQAYISAPSEFGYDD